jgi:hypothetical protein
VIIHRHVQRCLTTSPPQRLGRALGERRRRYAIVIVALLRVGVQSGMLSPSCARLTC